LNAGLRIEPHEAVGFVEQLCRAAEVPGASAALTAIDALRVTDRGTIVRPASLDGSDRTRLREAALVLRAALPDRGAINDSPAAELLRQLARALLLPDAEPGTLTLERFRQTLRPFAPHDAAEAVRAVFCRWWVLQGEAADLAPASSAATAVERPRIVRRRRRRRDRAVEPARAERLSQRRFASVVISNADDPMPWSAPEEIIDLESEGPTPWDPPRAQAVGSAWAAERTPEPRRRASEPRDRDGE
jgi:hypothetical protein